MPPALAPPMLCLQMRMRDLAQAAAVRGEPLPPAYHRCLVVWILLGCVAFVAMVVIFHLMVTKPA